MDIRYQVARAVQRVADDVYGGDAFPQPDNNLTRRVTKNVPNVIGQTVDQAQQTLQNEGWDVVVGPPVDSDQPTDIVAAQNPSGQAPGGTTITINPSNGQAKGIPNVQSLKVNEARAALAAAGFTNLAESCSESADAPDGPPTATGTNPPAGTLAGPSTQITVNYTAKKC
jgi:beta-lactam-binding protein with PASTA domain